MSKYSVFTTTLDALYPDYLAEKACFLDPWPCFCGFAWVSKA